MAKPATAAEKRHIKRIKGLPCLVCGAWRVEAHHVIGYADRAGHYPKDHRHVTPLCPRHHNIQDGPKESVHAHNHRWFFETYGIDLLAEARWLEQESIALGILDELQEAA